MIDRNEIDAKAQQLAIRPASVEKDYIFGWLLAGIFTASPLGNKLFLKGGNALRKGYFDETRYSDDLDFGMSGDIEDAALLDAVNEVCRWVEAKTGVSFTTDQNLIKDKFVETEGPSATPNLKVYEIRVYFSDFYGKPGSVRIRVSMDVTRFDTTMLPLQQRPLIHPYSDAHQIRCEITCMKLEEIVATKLKCLIQRQHAPDLFDYVYATRRLGTELDRAEVVRTFVRKTIFHKNPFLLKSILKEASPLDYIRRTWAATVICAQHVIMTVDEAIDAFNADLDLLFAGYSDNGYARFAYFPADQRAAIMRAGRDQTLLKIVYKGTERLVEPYSLKFKQKRDGTETEYFYVHNVRGGTSGPGQQSLVPENMQSLQNTDDKFEPRTPVELAKAGELPEDHLLYDPRKSKKPKSRRSRSFGVKSSRPRASRSLGGLKHLFNCVVCGKQFQRSTFDSTLKPHKGKNGQPCYGSYGAYKGTK